MSKFSEFLTKAMADESVKQELMAVANGKNISEITDDEFLKICNIGKKMGFDIAPMR